MVVTNCFILFLVSCNFLSRPIDLFGLDHNRYAIATAFGAAAGFIISIVLKSFVHQKTGSKWLDGMFSYYILVLSPVLTYGLIGSRLVVNSVVVAKNCLW